MILCQVQISESFAEVLLRFVRACFSVVCWVRVCPVGRMFTILSVATNLTCTQPLLLAGDVFFSSQKLLSSLSNQLVDAT